MYLDPIPKNKDQLY